MTLHAASGSPAPEDPRIPGAKTRTPRELKRKKQQLEELLAEKKRRQAGRRFDTYSYNYSPAYVHPQSGEKDGYRKHRELMCSHKGTIANLSANRTGKCITIDSRISTPTGERSVRELLESGEEFEVYSWDGARVVVARALAPFKKVGLHECYRLTMADGQWIECADYHRILTSSGWCAISELLPQFGLSHPPSNSESSPTDQRAGDPHWSGTPSNCPDGCSVDSRRCGERLLGVPGTGPVSPPSPSGVPERTFVSSDVDGLGNRHTNIHQPISDLLSIQDGRCPSAVPSVGFGFPTSCRADQPPACGFQVVQQSASGSSSGLQLSLEEDRHQPASCTSLLSPVVVGSANRVVSINPIGNREVYDLTVPVYGNYLAAGLIHHNTQMGAFICAVHATGLYPDWWTGVRYDGPVEIWAAGITGDTTRDIIQAELVGANYMATNVATGMIPGDRVMGSRKKQGNTVGALDSIYVKHVSGGTSIITLKSMEQGRAKFQGTAKHLVWLDEEPERQGYDIYSECATRTMTIRGAQVLITWTPLSGMTELVKYCLDHRGDKDFEVISLTWDDAPHLSEEEKEKRRAGYKPHEIEARTLGVPTLKEGLIYPFAQSEITCPPPEFIPNTSAVVIGMDIGTTSPTSAVLLAWDQRLDRITVVNEYAKENTERQKHAENLRLWGEGIYIACDPSANRTESDGKKTMKVYKDEYGLNINNADNAVDSGIESVREMFATGKLKISNSCRELLKELRFYQYKDGKVYKKDDHLLDALRYAITALKHARTLAYFKNAWVRKKFGGSDGSHGWKPGDPIVGY